MQEKGEYVSAAFYVAKKDLQTKDFKYFCTSLNNFINEQVVKRGPFNSIESSVNETEDRLEMIFTLRTAS